MTRIIAGAAGGRRLATPPGADTRPTSDRVREALFSRLEHLDAIEDAVVLDLYAGSGALGLEALSRGARRVVLVESARRAAGVARRNGRDVAAVVPAAPTAGTTSGRTPSGRTPGAGTTSDATDAAVPAAPTAGTTSGRTPSGRTPGAGTTSDATDAALVSVRAEPVSRYLATPPATPDVDLAFLDPPYDLSQEALAGDLAALVAHLREGAVVVVERSARSPEPTWPPTQGSPGAALHLVESRDYGETRLWYAEFG